MLQTALLIYYIFLILFQKGQLNEQIVWMVKGGIILSELHALNHSEFFIIH